MISSALPKAIVLLSGGLDSTTTLAIATSQGYEVYALSLDYGQKNRFELETAARIANRYHVAEHKMLTIDLRTFGGSSLTSQQAIERNRSPEEIGANIPSTYVPARNTLFLSYALAWADVLAAPNIFIGVNALDSSGYPDCRPEFIQAFQALANLATKMGTEGSTKIVIHTPLIKLRKVEIIRLGMELEVDYSMTTTCYEPLTGNRPCGVCDSCILRRRGFQELGIEDPLAYINQ